MQIRKQRMPEQGQTNLNRKESTYSQLPTMKKTHTSDQSTLKRQSKINKDEEYICKSQSKINQRKSHKKSETLSELNSSALDNVRKAFKGKSNVWRIAKAWKFAQKGYIQQNQLNEQIKKSFGIEISQKQSTQMFNHFSEDNKMLNIEQFLNLIYYQPDNTIIKPKLYDIKDPLKQRNSRIMNLIPQIEDNKYGSMLKEEINKDTQKCYQKKPDNIESHFYGKAQQFFSKTQFSKFSQNAENKHQINTRLRRQPLNPKNMENINQQKTRFGATPLSLIDKSNYDQFGQNLSQSSIQKPNKLEQKLERIREYQRVEKQNIMKIDNNENNRRESNLLRKKLEKQAYEYSSFLKNHWL